MDGLHEMAGSGVPIEIGGKTYLLSTLKAKHWGEAARVLNSRRKSPMEIARESLPGLPSEAQRHLLDIAFRAERDGDLLPSYEIERWFNTEEGAVYRFWMQINQRHDNITLERAEELLRMLDEESRARLDAAAKVNEALPQGNSSGQVQQIQETTSNGQCRGVVSFAS